MARCYLWRSFFYEILGKYMEIPLSVRKSDEFSALIEDDCVKITYSDEEIDEIDEIYYTYFINKAFSHGIDASFVSPKMATCLHEIGHIYTERFATKDEIACHWEYADAIPDFEEDNRSEWYSLAEQYRMLPLEERADIWAIMYIHMNAEKVREWDNKFKAYYRKNWKVVK